MAEKTDISWAHHTFNCWWGCFKVSPGCHHCYADTLARRYGHDIWGPASTTPRRLFGEKHWQEPLRWNAKAERDGVRRRVFCASMADVFEDHPQLDAERHKLWQLIEATPHLDWLLLTKRPENILTMIWLHWIQRPPHNVWYGTSAENQEYADLRIPALLEVPATLRFISAEPLLGPIDFTPYLRHDCDVPCDDYFKWHYCWCTLGLGCPSINWIITGGESGADARFCQIGWVRDIRDQCQAARVAFHHKQWGGRHHASGGRLLDGRTWDEFPVPRVEAVGHA